MRDAALYAKMLGLLLNTALALLVASVLFAALVFYTAPTRYRRLARDASTTATSTSKSQGNVKLNSSAQVLVLGDIGRSPRMQYHAASLADQGIDVSVVGFRESEIHPMLQNHARVRIVALSAPPSLLQTSNKLLFLICGPLKVVWQTLDLYHALSYRTKPAEWLLVQNPPSIPVLAVAELVSFLRSTKLVIDWHNYGWSVLALKLGRSHPLVKLAKLYEAFFSKRAFAHFSVTNAMSSHMKRSWNIESHALHDRPADGFRALSSSERSQFLERSPLTARYAFEIEAGAYRLIVSSTSWTADEDFSILLNALVAYSTRARENRSLPKIMAIITGKGPQKDFYLKQIEKLDQADKLSHARIFTGWLTTDDYALLLGAADLGISLHISTSGVDLPMKVVDMFGAGLPVIGWSDYEAWPELVKEGVNGRGFKDTEELERLLVELFQKDGKVLKPLKEGAVREGERRWRDEWNAVARPIFAGSKPNNSI